MEPITKLRFDALAGYTRRPKVALFDFQEIEWYSEAHERLLAVLAREPEDNDFGASILARDRKGRFRAIHNVGFNGSAPRACVSLDRSVPRSLVRFQPPGSGTCG
jgi:hypothetical protein